MCDTSVLEWKESNFAHGCDFPGHDLVQVAAKSDECGTLCDRRRECTHYTWTRFNNGTCWLKTGPVLRTDAIRTQDLSMICGLTNLNFKEEDCKQTHSSSFFSFAKVF